MKKRIVTGVLAAGLLVMAAIGLAGCGGRDKQVEPQLTPQVSDRVQWHPSKEELGARDIHLNADGVKASATVHYKNGNTGEIFYRTAGTAVGTVESAVIYYPSADKAQKYGPKARELKLDEQHTFLLDRLYRTDGVTLKYKGDRIDNATYESFEYQDVGSAVRKHQRFIMDAYSSKWKIDVEEQYRPDQTLDTTSQRRDDGSLIVKKFDDKGIVLWRQVTPAWGANIVTEFFEDDHITVKKSVDQSFWDVTVTLYHNNFRTEERHFTSNGRYMDVKIFDDHGHMILRQNWRGKNGDVMVNGKIDQSQYVLISADVIDPVTTKTVKEIRFYDDGVTPQNIRVREPISGNWWYPYTDRLYRQDGTLSDVIEYDSNGKQTKHETHTPQDNVREPLEPQVTARVPFDNPPPRLGTTPMPPVQDWNK